MIHTAIIASASLSDLLGLASVQRSFLAIILGSIGLPIAGVLIVGMDIIPARFAIMHLALLGVALGLLLGFDPVFGAVAVAVAGTGSIAPLARRSNGLSGPMGFLMTIAIAGALLVVSITGVNAAGAFELLWGSVIATTWGDLAFIAAIGVVVAAFTILRHRQLALLLYDREIAESSGIKIDRLTFVTLVIIAASVSSSIRLTGVLLVDSMTLLPALAARNLASSFSTMVGWAVGIGLIANTGGLIIALVVDQPPGPVMVLAAGTATLVTYIATRPQGTG